jgi:hypothetical protein
MMTSTSLSNIRGLLILSLMPDLIEAVLLEDHPLYREGLKGFLAKAIPNLTFSYDWSRIPRG